MAFGNISPFNGIDASMALNNVASMGPASALTSGYLTVTDWLIFNAKEPAITKLSAFNKAFGVIADTIAQGNDSRIIDGETAYGWGNHAGLYSLLAHNHSLDTLTNVTISANSDGEILRWTGSTWTNNTLIEAGIIKIDQTTAQTIGATGTRLTKLWSSDIDTASLTSSGRITITGGDATTYGYEALQLPNGISGIDAGLSTRILAGESIIQFGNNYQAHYTGSIDSSKAGAMIRIDTRNGSGASTYGGQAYTLFQIQTRVAGTTTSEIPFQITAAPTGSLIIGTTGLVTFGYGITTPGAITSTLANGTAPLTIASSTLVTNFNADTVDGYHASSFLQSVTAHDLLSATHSDTTSGAVVRGDIITGQGSTPKWVRLAFPATPTGKILQATATDVDWSTYPLTIGASASVAGSNSGDVALATDHGLSLSGQTLALGTPSAVTSSSSNAVSTTTHSHAITAGLGFIGSGTQANQILVTGSTPFTPTWTNADNVTSLNALSFASTSFVKMTAANTFGLDTNVYVIKSGDTGLGNMTFSNNAVIDVVSSVGTDVLNIGTGNADTINIGYSGSTININGTLSYQAVDNLTVHDKLITLNKGGGISSATSSGFELEENGAIAGWFTTSSARTGFELRAPANSYSAIFLLSVLGAERTYTFPDSTGTIALTSNLHNAVTLATDSGLALSTQMLNMGTPSTVTSSTSNAVSTNTHSHAITAGLGFIGNGTQANEILITGATPFAPVWTLATNLVSLNALSFASTSFVKMSAAGTFGLDTTTYLSSVTAHNLLSATHGDTLADTAIRGDILIGNSTPKWARLAFPATPTGKVLIASATDIEWSASALGTAAYTASTAYDVSGAAAAITPTTLGLVIGTNVQAYNSNLTGINQALTTTSSPSFTAVGATTFTGALTGHASSDALVGQQFYIGTTQVAINRTTAALVLTGITSIDGTAAKAANLVGGSSTTLLGSMGYQSNTDVTTMLAPNTTSTLKFLSQTGTGTNGAAPTWHQILMTELPPLANDTWLTALNYAGGTSNLFKLSADNVMEFASAVKICALYHVLNSGFNDIVDIPVDSTSPDNTQHGVGISIDGVRVLSVSALSTGAGSVDTPVVYVVGNVSADSFTDRTPYYDGDALTAIKVISSKDGKIDHTTLPNFAQSITIKDIIEDRVKLEKTINEDGVEIESETIEKVKIGEEQVIERDLGAMISILTVAVQQLTLRVEELEGKLKK